MYKSRGAGLRVVPRMASGLTTVSPSPGERRRRKKHEKCDTRALIRWHSPAGPQTRLEARLGSTESSNVHVVAVQKLDNADAFIKITGV